MCTGICVGVGTKCAIVCGWDGFVLLCVEVCKGVDKGEGVWGKCTCGCGCE